VRPAGIRVFDGLRVTTDHVEHLQASFRSALQELRLVAGPGRVHQGFEVQATDEGHVTVLPGLAFDAAGNRIACDEPTVLEVAFGPGSGRRYVGLRHRQVGDGVLEGQATMLWDGCSVELDETRPAPEEGALALAELIPREGGTGFEVRSLEPGRSDPAAGWLGVRQGVVRLEGGDDPAALAGFWEALGRPGDGGGGVAFPLAERAVATDLACCASLSVLATVEATVRYQAAEEPPPAEAEAAESVAPEVPPPAGEEVEPVAPGEPAPAWMARTVAASTVGEATFDGDRVAQFGLAQVHTVPCPGDPGPPCFLGSHLTEEAVVCLPLSVPRGRPAGGDDEICALLGGLQVQLRAQPAAAPGSFTLGCRLWWSGSPSAALGRLIEAPTPRLRWSVVAAWKGLGHTTPAQDATGGS
jgi:hypothetical protein